jgi:hypothetical protein
MTARPITIAYCSHIRELIPGQSFTFDLEEENKPDRIAREREQERACKGRTVEGTEDRAA